MSGVVVHYRQPYQRRCCFFGIGELSSIDRDIHRVWRVAFAVRQAGAKGAKGDGGVTDARTGVYGRSGNRRDIDNMSVSLALALQKGDGLWYNGMGAGDHAGIVNNYVYAAKRLPGGSDGVGNRLIIGE